MDIVEMAFVRKITLSSCCLCLMLAGMPGSALATLDKKMNDMFNSMSNTTNPQAYMGQSMGAITGGGVIVRNRIVNENMIGIAPPHITAGCGGIDMFGGSFSFINAKQFTNLLRSIASNAQGYFFQLGLQAMCPSCMNIMSGLQKRMQALNQGNADSCKIGKKIVDAAVIGGLDHLNLPDSGFFSFSKMRDLAVADETANGSLFTDTEEANHPSNKKNQAQTLEEGKPGWMLQKGYLGNIAWDVLQNAHVDKWTTFAGGDKDLFETMISITGTVILSMPKNNNQTGPGGIGAKNPETKTVDYTIDMNDLINKHQRKNIEILRCKPADGDPTGVKCLNMVPEQPPNFQSMADRIKGVLIGDANNGLVYKFRHPAIGQKMTVKEKALTELMPMPMIKMIRSFGTEGDSSAKFFTEKTIPIIAEAMVESFIEDMIRVFSDAKHSAPPAMRVRIPKFEALLAEADNRNFKIIQANAAKFNQTLDFFKTFETLRANSKKKKLLFKQLSQTKRNGD